MVHCLDTIQAHTGAAQAQAVGEVSTMSNPLWRVSVLLLLWKKNSAEGVIGKASLTKAKLAAGMFNDTKDLQLCLHLVMGAIHENDKQFFIDFGKCLSDDISPELFSKYERDVAEIVLQLDENPGMPTSAGVRELHQRGHTGMTEENLRNWKSRPLRVKPQFQQMVRAMGLPVTAS